MAMWINLTACVLLFSGSVGLWILVHLLRQPRLKTADGRARITGTCGDTMEIRLKFKAGRVTDTAHDTDGCSYSLTCILAAVRLSGDKSPEEILDIDADAVARYAGGLPEDHRHCAVLAVKTLHSAVDDYMQRQCGCACSVTGYKGEDG